LARRSRGRRYPGGYYTRRTHGDGFGEGRGHALTARGVVPSAPSREQAKGRTAMEDLLRQVMARAGEALEQHSTRHPHNPPGEPLTDPPLPQRAPIGVGVQDLRPLRGRPCGSILDPATYLDASTISGKSQIRDQLQ
jgi:hypothetical protein